MFNSHVHVSIVNTFLVLNIQSKLYFREQEKKWPFSAGDCLIEVAIWAGLIVASTGFDQLISPNYDK